MKIERLTSLPATPPVTAEQLIAISKSHRRCSPKCVIAPSAGDAVAPLIAPALALIESRWGIIASTGTYRITTDDVPSKKDAVLLPIAPVLTVNSVKLVIAAPVSEVGVEMVSQVRFWRGAVIPMNDWPVADPAHGLTIEVLASWPLNTVPHLLIMATAAICAYWLANPTAAAANDPGTSAITAQQFLEPLLPAHPAILGASGASGGGGGQ